MRRRTLIASAGAFATPAAGNRHERSALTPSRRRSREHDLSWT